jgi:hypothetical protein
MKFSSNGTLFGSVEFMGKVMLSFGLLAAPYPRFQ